MSANSNAVLESTRRLASSIDVALVSTFGPLGAFSKSPRMSLISGMTSAEPEMWMTSRLSLLMVLPVEGGLTGLGLPMPGPAEGSETRAMGAGRLDD